MVQGLPLSVTAGTVTEKDFSHVKVGDTVIRFFVGKEIPMIVTSVDDNLITAGLGWQFERKTGFEYDPDCHSGSEFGVIISHLIEKKDGSNG